MTSKSDSVQKASDLEVPSISISEPKRPIYVTKEDALEYVKNELAMVKDYRKTSFEKMEESKKISQEKAANYHVTLDYLENAQRKHEIAENVMFAAAMTTLASFIVYGGHRLFRWVSRRREQTHGRTDDMDHDSQMEEEEGLQEDAFPGTSRRLHSRDWRMIGE
jgi:hypothetical protein